jgi:hypothetical protein
MYQTGRMVTRARKATEGGDVSIRFRTRQYCTYRWLLWASVVSKIAGLLLHQNDTKLSKWQCPSGDNILL